MEEEKLRLNYTARFLTPLNYYDQFNDIFDI